MSCWERKRCDRTEESSAQGMIAQAEATPTIFALNTHTRAQWPPKHTAALPKGEPFSFTKTNKEKISLKAYYNCCAIKTSDKLLGLIASSVQ